MWISRAEFDRVIARAEQAEAVIRLLRTDLAHWRQVSAALKEPDSDWAIGVRDVVEALSDRVNDSLPQPDVA